MVPHTVVMFSVVIILFLLSGTRGIIVFISRYEILLFIFLGRLITKIDRFHLFYIHKR